MNYRCPQKCNSIPKKCGRYWRSSDSKWIQRFECGVCKKGFSQATFSSCVRQKKRRINPVLFGLLASGVSQRRAAILLNVHRTTIKRKFDFLAKQAKKNHEQFLKTIKVNHLQFDDLVTSCHTKLKPLSVSVAVDANTRKLLSLQVSQIPAFGHLAKLSKRKYGRRKNKHPGGLNRLFLQIKSVVLKNAIIKSDEHKLYAPFVKKYFPDSNYTQYKSLPGCVAGQGELKKTARDPLFAINHTLAMMRANINRLFRRTWCTTKLEHKLQQHLDLYMRFHNERLV